MMEPMGFGTIKVEDVNAGAAGGAGAAGAGSLDNGSKNNLLEEDEPSISKLPEMICGTVQRHCAVKPTALYIRKKVFTRIFSTVHSDIFSRETNQCLYKCVYQVGALRDKKVIMDMETGLPVLNFKTKTFRLSNEFSFRLGGNSLYKFGRCCILQTMSTTQLSVSFEDALTMEHRCIVLQGKHWGRTFRVYWGDPNNDGIVIARAYPPSRLTPRFLVDDYYVDIRQGVDIGLILGLLFTADDYYSIMS